MKIFLSSLENGCALTKDCWLGRLDEMPFKLKWNLVSYFYARAGDRRARADLIRDRSELLMVDSGAHSFQKGQKVKWDDYTRAYAKFIREFDRPNVIGYFEMDVDVIIGYPRVLELRRILLSATDKIIPVWHKGRGIEEFDKMCRHFAGKIIAFSGFKNEDIADHQYMMFLKHAKRYGCKVHCLGMTRRAILDQVPFDYVDSSSWRQPFIYARCRMDSGETRRADSDWFRYVRNRDKLELRNYLWGMRMQEHYYEKWRKCDENSGRDGRDKGAGEWQDEIPDFLR